jgi:hypothetical protein
MRRDYARMDNGVCSAKHFKDYNKIKGRRKKEGRIKKRKEENKRGKWVRN